VNIRRAYGNWTSASLKGWEAILHDHAIQPIQQYRNYGYARLSDLIDGIGLFDLQRDSNMHFIVKDKRKKNGH
jgi:hypothetical protein